MKAFIVLATVVACASAQHLVLSGYNGLALAGAPIATSHHLVSAPITYAAPAVVAPAVTKTQYHSQDELGQASFGHAEPGAAHAAVRDAFGNVAGSYAYINPEGKEIRVSYTAGHDGFRVASNALPIAPTAPEAPAPVALVAPVPVEDTPEVKAAKAAHAKAIEDARNRNAEADKADAEKPQSRRKRGIIAAAPLALPVAAPAAIAYHAAPAAVAYHAAPAAIAYHAAPVATVVAAPAVREATLTTIKNNPGHAVSYRVD